MGLYLKDIFPGNIGSYTPPGEGHSHAEVIIWDNTINEKLHGVSQSKSNQAWTNNNS